MSKKKIDLKKIYPEQYKPKKIPVIVDIPSINYLMIDGHGDPNTAQMYQEAIETLYSVSYALKMKIVKKENPENDYVVPPLEGLWYMDDMDDWSLENKDEWKWTSMIRVPDFVSKDQVLRAIELVKETKNPSLINEIRFEEYNEGTVVQLLYIGRYENEAPIIAEMHEYAYTQGYKLNGKHHEIYLSDPRKGDPEKNRTVIRQPITKVNE